MYVIGWSICLTNWLSVYISLIFPFTYIYISLICRFVFLFVYLSIYLSIELCLHLSICLSIYDYPMYKWMSQLTKQVGGLEHVSFFVRILGMSSSQVTNIVQRGWNHQPALICLSMNVYLLIYLSIYQSINISINLSIWICLFVYLSIYLIVLNYILPIRSTFCYLYVMYIYIYMYIYVYIYSCVVIWSLWCTCLRWMNILWILGDKND
jgi:hypothetical protein